MMMTRLPGWWLMVMRHAAAAGAQAAALVMRQTAAAGAWAAAVVVMQ
jgi:hypothetical protein